MALDRAAAEAERRGLAGRIRFEQADLTTWTPTGRHDLVTASFLHPPSAARGPLYARRAGAVAPGGTLLLVQHDPSDAAVVPRPNLPDLFATAQELAADLEPAQWDIITAAAKPRTVHHPEHGGEVTVHDAVLVARRQS